MLPFTVAELPERLALSTMVPYRDTVILVGGDRPGDQPYLDKIYMYDKINDSWSEVEAKLGGQPRFMVTALMVDPLIFPPCD